MTKRKSKAKSKSEVATRNEDAPMGDEYPVFQEWIIKGAAIPVFVEWVDSVYHMDYRQPAWVWPEQIESMMRDDMQHMTIGFLLGVKDQGVTIAQSIRGPHKAGYAASLIKIPCHAIKSIRMIDKGKEIKLKLVGDEADE